MDILTIFQYAASIGAGIAAINQWIIKPLRKVYESAWIAQKEENEKFRKEIEELNKKFLAVEKSVKVCQEDGADMLGDRLMQAYEYFIQRGWATPAEKDRFIRMHQRYAARGHNHLIQSYEEDLLDLPNHP